MDWIVYILRCADGTYYTGITNDLPRRIEKHNAGKGAKYTAARKPVTLVYSEEHESRSTASKREAEIKKLSRTDKGKLINNDGTYSDLHYS